MPLNLGTDHTKSLLAMLNRRNTVPANDATLQETFEQPDIKQKQDDQLEQSVRDQLY